MNKLYNHLRSKIEQLQLAGSSWLKLNFYKAILGILRWIIILTQGAGKSFPLIFQTQGSKTITRSYKEFKSYQRKVRFIFLLLLVLMLAIFKFY